MNTLKSKIKELALAQKDLKNQRKTVRLVGVRTMDTSIASYKHWSNRIALRYYNVAYGLLRGLQLEQIENKSKEPLNMRDVNKLKEQYEHEFRTTDTADTNG